MSDGLKATRKCLDEGGKDSVWVSFRYFYPTGSPMEKAIDGAARKKQKNIPGYYEDELYISAPRVVELMRKHAAEEVAKALEPYRMPARGSGIYHAPATGED